MSVRLFHRGARVVIPLSKSDASHVWCALHVRKIAWAPIFGPTLDLLGLGGESNGEALRFAGGSLDWTNGAFWTTIRLRLPPCSPKKAALLAAGLLKAARYAGERSDGA
jgi:hypothetical protein